MNPVLRRILLDRSMWLAFLLIFVVLSFSNGMSSGIRGGITWLLSITAVAGSLTGYALANARINAWLAAILIAFVGLTGITIYFTNLIEPFLQLISALLSIRDQLISWVRLQDRTP